MNADTRLRPLALDVVSVQSQVVYGRVGNSLAVPVLQAAGLRVAGVPSVLLSNTPHYPSLHGGAVDASWFAGWLADLDARGATAQLRQILVGYLGSPAQAAHLARWIAAQLAARPALAVQVDPVIGDHDSGIYVAPGLVEGWRTLLPLAEGLTPNGFELAHLTGAALDGMDTVIAAARRLLGGRTRWVVVTSAAPEHWRAGHMLVAVVTRDTAEVIEHARIDAVPKGTGDLFAASLAAGLLGGQALHAAARAAAGRVVDSLVLTREACSAELLVAGIPALG
ncbi:pyridoxine/pyridoxal/pyridoxamine kinase [Dokdonella sp.]|uniref:pyridoxine/pyridoxal/pyridoxamine kinase n=1 Tax=Dokdonella sp. TaxID=2291710 RepID=UPI0031C2D919|nr:pyridoxine/pyridoxal/pyridoxamine kinase [Dokdonella sp.]